MARLIFISPNTDFSGKAWGMSAKLLPPGRHCMSLAVELQSFPQRLLPAPHHPTKIFWDTGMLPRPKQKKKQNKTNTKTNYRHTKKPAFLILAYPYKRYHILAVSVPVPPSSHPLSNHKYQHADFGWVGPTYTHNFETQFQSITVKISPVIKEVLPKKKLTHSSKRRGQKELELLKCVSEDWTGSSNNIYISQVFFFSTFS